MIEFDWGKMPVEAREDYIKLIESSTSAIKRYVSLRPEDQSFLKLSGTMDLDGLIEDLKNHCILTANAIGVYNRL